MMMMMTFRFPTAKCDIQWFWGAVT